MLRSAFFWFSQDERKKVRAANPNFGVGEVAKELGRRWSDVDAGLKAKYEEMAEKDRARYGKEKKVWQEQQKRSLSSGVPVSRDKSDDPPDDDAEEEDEMSE